ncbi:isochorismatase family protein [Streptacidiphilus griseoplanus]|uniref:isochorismatase family protein n=1 Tax=Peterkaempfera griseoplana TaxID=66896 RepID=UPI0015885E9F|nr:isochorismatase family protein [Peterkaempfera griseoplana]
MDRLEKDGVLSDPQVRDALLAVPREVIVPRGYVRLNEVVGTSESVWRFLDGHHPADRAQWLEALHGEDSLMVQLPGEDPRTTPRGRIVVGGGFASMTTAAVGSVRLLQPLGLQPGMRLLEAGTGPGLVTALACHILGDQHVTSLEVDPAMAAGAREHLARAGYRPRLLCTDALGGVEGEQFDRIVLGFSTRQVPATLLDQLAPGGVLFGCVNSGSGSWPASVLVHRTGDGVEAVIAPWPGSGTARAAGQDWYTAPAAPGPMDRERWSDVALPERTGQGAGFWLAAGHMLGLVRGTDPEGGGWTLHHPASESVTVATRPDGSSRWHVAAGGPVEVWKQVEELHRRWQDAGAPDRYRLDLTDPNRQRVSSGSSAHALTWTLPAARSSSPDTGDHEQVGAAAPGRESTAGRAAVPAQAPASGSDDVGSTAAWPKNFRRWLAGEECSMCATPDHDDIGWGLRYMRGIYLDAYLWRSGRVRGYTVVRWKGSRHVADPTELSEEEAAGFWRELLAVGEALKRHYEPLKLNIELLGNVVPHLHAHMYPRTVDDPAPGGPMPWAFLDEGHQDEAQLAADVQALRLLIGQDAGSAPVREREEVKAADPGTDRATKAAQQTMTGPGAGALVHQWRIAPREYERQEDRRGRRHAFLELDPLRTALLVIDVVPFSDGPYLRGIVPQVNWIADVLRQAGGLVYWVLPGTGERRPVREEFFGTEVAEMFRVSGGAGPLPARLLDGLAVDEERDVLLEKTGTSALFPGSSDLLQLLQQRDITTLVLCGTVTSVCVESTARDAAELGYRIIVVADGCADGTDDAHNASLRALYRSFGDVRPAAEVLGLIGAGSPSR